ncbi:methyltransferase domain-containing protein [Devosia epidermidihirudinis]|uniref:methyltransferase domain-containing protein n=1 Tax=Devosia epidermidihirudinis TaxID=1293439 RepID=UPI000696072C|nr:methyltransferase domain-containing protein [Devosia epidermidihirudinis]
MTTDVTTLTQAVQAEPDSAGPLVQLGNALLANNRPAEALTSFEKARDLRPKDGAVLRGLAQSQLDVGLRDDALASFRALHALIPYDRYATYMIGALSGSADARAQSYVPDLFDAYAQTFDEHLTGPLQYRIPEIIRDTLAEIQPIGRVLDLGCGTGLVGVALEGLASAIDGIDISSQMVRKAEERGLYRTLRSGDIVSVLNAATEFAGPYEVIIAADVFVYVGPLDAVFTTVAERLGPDGKFIFSVEDLVIDGLTVRSSGRYAHSVSYITQMAEQHGLEIVERQPVTIRQERDQPIPGSLYLTRRAGTDKDRSALALETAPK